MLALDTLSEVVEQHGFQLIGVAPVEPIGGGWFAPHAERFKAWLASGKDASMEWLAKRAHERTVPESLLPGVKNAIVLWMNHRTPTPARPEGRPGKVAAYAWGRDYHNVTRKALRKVDRWLFEQCPELNRYISLDTGAILERAYGERAGVGWIGRSTMLIHPQLGTFGSIAVIFTDQDLPTREDPHPYRCGTCTDCVDLCPTDALSDQGLDSRLCISYWTIEHRGLIPRDVRPMLEDWVFGCDICQDVCPWNTKAPRADPTLWRPQQSHAWPDLVDWLQTDSSALEEQLLGSPLRRARGVGLRRNALIVLANTNTAAALPAIRDVLRQDPDPVLRATAAWAAHQLGCEEALKIAAADDHPLVVAESQDPLDKHSG